MTTGTSLRLVDDSAIRVNQAFIVGLLALAFVLNSVALAAFVALTMLVGTAFPRLALFQAIYRCLLRPADIVRPHVHPDNPEPHRFAQGVGGTLVALGTVLLLVGSSFGWALVLVVVALAAVNLFFGFCAGCFMYYQLNRLGAPGFHHSPIQKG